MPPINGLVPANFPNDLLYDAGIVMAGSFKFGVTRGAPSWDPARSVDNIDFDGRFSPLKGGDRVMHGDAKLAFSMLEIGPAASGNQITKLEPGAVAVTVAAPATPGPVTATGSISGGTLAAGTYYYKVTALNVGGESLASAEATATITSGTSGSVSLSLTPIAGATAYRYYRGASPGAQTLYYQSANSSFVDTGSTLTSVLATPPTSGSGSTITYTPPSSGGLLQANDYIANFRAIWERGNNAGYFAVHFPTALVTKYTITGANKGQSLIAVEVSARLDPATQVLSAAPYVLEYRTALP